MSSFSPATGRICRLVLLIFKVLTVVRAASHFNCAGGTIYFIAHPADGLLYQNPDLFHDLYVLKCVTTVVFTSGDRGHTGNFSASLERGLEAAYMSMVGMPANRSGWVGQVAKFDDKQVALRYLKAARNIQIMYLRLPSGKPDGQAFDTAGGGTLKKLYQGTITTMTTTEGNSSYTLQSLQSVISAILLERNASSICVLDKSTAIPVDDQNNCDHADHAVSTRIVTEVVEKNKIDVRVVSYAGGFSRKLEPTLNITTKGMKAKMDAFFRYAAYDKDMCQDYIACFAIAESTAQILDEDVHYVANWLDREYYLQ